MRHGVYVNCGSCPSCIMDKADKRSSRIRATGTDKTICFFVTLTYSNLFVPYIRLSDIVEYDEFTSQTIPVYRDFDVRYNRIRVPYKNDETKHKYRTAAQRKHIDKPINNVLVNYQMVIDLQNRKFKALQGQNDKEKIGICYFSDVQNFIKRLKINLTRSFNYDPAKNYFKFYQCSEYGPTTCRPHFHLLVYVEKDKLSLSSFASAVVKSWSYALRSRTRRYVEIAKDAASYVATYVNRDSDVSLALQENFSEKHSYSHGFGVDVFPSSLSEIEEKIYSGTLTYNTLRMDNKGTLTLVTCLYPKYYLNRFFPKFKGYSRFTSDEIRSIVEKPFTIVHERFKSKTIDFTDEDFRTLIVSLNNACARSGYHPTIYADLFVRCWNSFASQVYKLNYSLIINKWQYRYAYDNIYDFYGGNIDAPTLDFLMQQTEFVTDCNDFPYNVTQSNAQASKYFRKIKIKQLNYELL